MNEQTIDFDDDGCPVSLRFPRGKGFDLRHLGAVRSERTSDIQINPDTQQWEVTFLQGERKGTKMTVKDVLDSTGIRAITPTAFLPLDNHPDALTTAAWFADYEDAIPYEVSVVQHLRSTFGPNHV